MKFLILADIQDLSWKHGTGVADIVLSCGDVDDQVILSAADSYGCKAIFAVKGNHDRDVPFTTPIVDVHLKVQEYNGITFGGLNGAWKYKTKGAFLYEQSEVDSFLKSFPTVDIFLSHNSPRSIHERDQAIHQGFGGLVDYIKRSKPVYLVHGHQHVATETKVYDTTVIGTNERRILELK